jgi:hypothetical protein
MRALFLSIGNPYLLEKLKKYEPLRLSDPKRYEEELQDVYKDYTRGEERYKPTFPIYDSKLSDEQNYKKLSVDGWIDLPPYGQQNTKRLFYRNFIEHTIRYAEKQSNLKPGVLAFIQKCQYSSTEENLDELIFEFVNKIIRL